MSYSLTNNPSSVALPEEDDDLELLQHDDEGRKILNFRDLKEFYSYLVKSQIAEARNKMGKAWVENFQKTNFIRVSFKDEIPRPDNYKKMVELHQEVVNHSEVYNKMKSIEKNRRQNEGPKQYLCSKCGLPKKGHTCKAGEYGVSVSGVGGIGVIGGGEIPPVSNTGRRKTRDHIPNLEESEIKRRRPGSYTTSNSTATLLEPLEESRPRSRGAILDQKQQQFLQQQAAMQSGNLLGHPMKDQRLNFKTGGQVLVIGGGIAGLAAARELKRSGMSVIILEARDRIGGRIHTITSDELNQGRGIDIGASFVYRATNNPFIHDLCSDRNLLHILDGSCILYDSAGKPVSSSLNAVAENIFNESLNEISNSRNRSCIFFKRRLIRDHFERTITTQSDGTSNQRDQPLGTFLSDFLTSWQKKNTITVDTWAVLNWYLANFESLYGTDVSKLSLNNFDQDDTGYNDGANCLIYQGYGYIVNHLSQGLDVRLGTQVEKIAYDSNRVKVSTSKGTFEANHLVCTLPLGILKEGNVQFSPPLPTEKIDAISRLGNGLLNKLILFFPTCFWDKNADFIGNVNQPQSRGEFFLFINMEKVVQSPILVGLVGGQAAEALETKTGEEVVGLAMKTLHRIYGSAAASPNRAVVTRWANDPFAKGAFSCLSVGCTGEEYDILAKPVGDKIFFAGEATHRVHPATVTGAYLSGQRAAAEILQVQVPQFDMMDPHLINPPPPLQRSTTPPINMHPQPPPTPLVTNSPNPLHTLGSPIFQNSPNLDSYFDNLNAYSHFADESQLQ